MYTSVLFDLDGTLTDSKEGIIKSVEYALIQMGETTEGRLDQHIIVGPPLVTTFRETFGFSEEKARETYAHFQQRYSTIGKFENRAFDGVVPMLQRLQERGVRSFVATSKPEVHAKAICEKFGIAPYVEMIAGPDEAKRAVMVGDRQYDVCGARETGLPVIVVGYGYGNEEERRQFPPDFFVSSVAELEALILQ